MSSGSSPPASSGSPTTLRRGSSVAILAGLLSGILLGALDNTVVVTALPKIVSDLRSTSGLSFVVTSYLIAQTISFPIFGKLSDYRDRRLFFLIGVVIFVIGSMLAGLSQNLDELILFRAVQGVGSGAFFPIAISIIAVLYSPQQRARLSGLFSSVFGVAIVIGPFLGSYIVDHTTWRWVFYVNLPVGVFSFLTVLLTVRSLKPAHRETSFDWPGGALLASWVAAFMFPLLEVQNGWAWTDARTIGLLVTSLVLFAFFLIWESRAEDPMIPLRFFRRRVVAAGTAVGFLRGAILIVITTYIAIFISQGLGGSPDTIRDVLYGFLVPMILGSVVGGFLLPRLGYRPLVLGGMVLMAVGAYFLTGVSTSSSAFSFRYGFIPMGLIAPLIPTGFGIGVTFAGVLLAVQYGLPMKDVGISSSLVQFMGNLGGAIALPILSSYQQGVFNGLRPSGPPPVPCPPPLTNPPTPISSACTTYLAQLSHAATVGFQGVFWGTFFIAIAAVFAATFIVGRLPSGFAPPAEAAERPGRQGTLPATSDAVPLN